MAGARARRADRNAAIGYRSQTQKTRSPYQFVAAFVFATGDREQISVRIDVAGAWGPALVVLVMTVAIVATPIPSAPVALAAGAGYGHSTGIALVVAGVEIGALAALL